MPSPETGIRDASPVRQPVLLGLFTGTAVGAGYLLAGIPNVELMTLITALAGSVLGAGRGFLCGALAACIYSLGSPYGLPVPLILAAQAVGMGAAGLAGSWLGPTVMALVSRRRRTPAILAAAGCGVLVAGVFDVLTNLAIVAAFSLPPLVVAGGAIPFFLIHAGSNAAIFGVFLPLMLPRLRGLARPPLLARALAILVLGGPLLGGGSPARAQVPAAQDSVAQVPAAQDSAAQDSGVAQQGAPADTTGLPVPPAAPPPAGPLGWRRPLWDPFIPTALGWLSWHTPYLPVSDGGLGAVARILGDAGSSPVPLVLRDGVPLGTGHVLADDPALLPQVGLGVGGSTMGLDGWGGSGGLLELAATDPDPTAAMTGYWGSKGPHETYTRSVRWLTAQSTWRATFDFEENLDLEGYNYTALPDEEFDPVVDENFPGHARIRLNRTRLTRNLSPLAGLAVQYDSGRKTKDGLPALGTAHQEIWQDGVAVALRDVRGRLGVQAVAYWRNGDVGWGDSPGDPGPQWRLLETGREGVHCDLFLQQDAPARAPAVAAAPDTSGGTSGNTSGDNSGDTSQRAPKAGLSRLRLSFARWTLEDSGTAEPWAAEFTGPLSVDGQQAYLAWRTGVRTGGLRATAEGAGRWSDALGWDPGGELRFEQDAERPVWGIYAQQGGRDPRSDELATPLRHVVDGRELVLLPEPALMREKTQAVGGDLACRLLGTELAVAVSLTRLEDGITWLASASDQAQGRWHNGLQLDAVRVRASVGREGRFLGWGRAALEGTWQKFDEISGRAAFLPPARTLRLRLLWENHFFQEDGILQLGLLSTRVGEMADPWDVTRAFGLPERTVHDLIVSFRLVGADLSLAFRNLTDERHQLTSGAASAGRELDLRLNWTFRH